MRKGLALLLAAVMLLCFGGCKKEKTGAVPPAEDPVVTVYLLTERVCGEEKTVYTYNENGEKTLVIEYWGENENDRTEYTYTYDENGRVTKMTYSYGGQKENPSHMEYTYDEQGNRREQTSEQGESQLYIYDAAGNLIQRIRYDNNGAELSRYGFSYDGKGNLTKTIYEDIHYRTYVYGDSGNLLQETVYYEDVPYSRTEYVYNDQGELVKAIRTAEDAERETMTYTKLQLSWSRAKYLALDPGTPNVVIRK